MSNYVPNPKLEGSNIVAAFPQGKPCPIGCNQCYAREGLCYCPMDQPNMPPVELAGGKIVRVNDVGDSNVERELVITSTNCYKDRYFNTSVPDLSYPGPTVLTVNPKEEDSASWTEPQDCRRFFVYRLMAVRVRVSPANLRQVVYLVAKWQDWGVPVLLMHMRYYDAHALYQMLTQANGRAELSDYIHKVHIKNESYQLTPDKIAEFNRRLGIGSLHGVYECGKYGLCRDCGLCEILYKLCKRRMEDVT